MKKIASTSVIAIALMLAASATVSATPAPITPEVAVTVYQSPDGYQMDWDGPFLREHGEEWCATTRCVNDTLTNIGQEWTYSVEWKQV